MVEYLIDTKYFQVWLNPYWGIISIEIYHGITFRFSRLLIHVCGDRRLKK